jgi:peptide/nickel transport system substrate-binding protein
MERDQSLSSGGISRRTALRLVAASGAVALLAACQGAGTPPAATTAAGATQAPPKAGAPASTPVAAATKAGVGTLTVALSDLGNQNLDVILASTNNNVLNLIYERLMLYNEKGELIPALAESWSMSPDGRQWTFNLRKGVKWSNGDDFTSADVALTFQRFVSDESKSAWSPMHRQTVERVETPDANTVKVFAKAPPYLFYEDAVAGTYEISKNHFEKVGPEVFTQQPMGTGPYKLTSFTPSSKAELEVNSSYWGTKPVWDKIVLLHAPEESTRIAMLKRGEADIAGVSFDNAVALRSEGFELRQTKASTVPSLCYAGYWMTPGPTSDQRVREAMDLAINRQELVDSFFKGFAKPGAGNFALTDLHYGFDPIWYSTKYDPERAKQLLKDAGYPGKFQNPAVKLFSGSQVGWQPDFMQIISGYWEAVGIQTQIVPMDFTAMRTNWVAGDPNMMGGVVPWIGVGSGAAGNQMPAQQNNMTSKGVNHAANDPELDKMFADTIAELDAKKRLDMWHTVQQKAFALHSFPGITRVYDQYAVSSKVGEFAGPTHLSQGFFIGLPWVQRK